MSIAAYKLRLEESYTRGVVFRMKEFRAALKVLRKRAGGRNAVALKIGIAPSTIQNAERGPDMPGIETIAKIVEGCGATLSEFFRQLEAGLLQTVELSKDNPPPADLSPVVADDSLPHLDSEERIAQTVLRRLARFAIEGLESVPKKRPPHYRLPASARPFAAESSVPPRKNRTRHVPRKKKKRR